MGLLEGLCILVNHYVLSFAPPWVCFKDPTL
jgi:hypothetical protein